MSQQKNYRVRWLALGILAITTVLPIPLAASGEGGVMAEITEVTIEAGDAGYKFTLSTDEKRSLKTIKVEWGGKAFEFGKGVFGNVSFPDFREYQVKAPTDNSWGKQDAVILILPYNRESVDEGEESYNQWDVVRLHFNKGELSRWQKAEAVKGKPGEWKLTSKGEVISHIVDGVDKVDKNGVHDNGSTTSKKNPYDQGPIGDR